MEKTTWNDRAKKYGKIEMKIEKNISISYMIHTIKELYDVIGDKIFVQWMNRSNWKWNEMKWENKKDCDVSDGCFAKFVSGNVFL